MNIALHSHMPPPAIDFAGVAARANPPRRHLSPTSAPEPDGAIPPREPATTAPVAPTFMPTAEQLTQLRYAGIAQAIDRLTATQKKSI